MKIRAAYIVVVLGIICVLGLSATGFAQSISATVSGRVFDPNAAVIVEATVTAKDVDRGVETVVQTNEVGIYVFPNLSPGNYEFSVSKRGFSVVVKPGVTLHVGDTISMNFTMKVGGVSETITVEGGVPLMNTQSGSVGTVINRDFVGSLPLNGRSFDQLILLTPGVTLNYTASADGGVYVVNGQRGNANNFTVDGVSVNFGVRSSTNISNYSAIAGNGPGLTSFGGTNGLVSVDALEEFKVQTSSYSADLGRQPGAQVSIITRSGTNQYHGTLYDYLRNEALDARNYFNKVPALKPPLRQNDFGGTFSGPIKKNKTFFFASYEGMRLRLPTTGSIRVPSLRLRQLAPAGLKTILNAFPVPDATVPELLSSGQPSGFTPYTVGLSLPGHMNTGSVRIDHIVSSKLTLFGRYNQSSSQNTGTNFTVLYPMTPGYNSSATRTVTLGANWVPSARLSNELRFNYSQQQADSGNVSLPCCGACPVTLADLTPGYSGGGRAFGAAMLSFAGQNAWVELGGGNKYVAGQINMVDNVLLVKGKHQFKFGVDYRRLADTYGPPAYSASMSFRSQADIINGVISSFSVSANQGSLPRFQNLSLYAQDSWKLSPQLALEAGLRWELNPPPHDANGRTPVLALGVTATDVAHATLAPSGTPYYKTVYTGFSPRFGLAYQLNQKSGREMVLRGGFGLFYDMGNGQASTGIFGGLPFSASISFANVPFPVPATLAVPPPFPSNITLPITADVTAVDPNLKLPYTLQWNVALEQALGREQWLSVSYVASRGRRLLYGGSLNYPAYLISGPLANPNFGYIYFNGGGSTSQYDSMQVQYKARLRHGLQALVNYTWSHALDEGSSEAWANSPRGNADFDIRHNLSAAVTYKLPSPSAAPVLKQVLSGWSVDGIVRDQTPLPEDISYAYLIPPGSGAVINARPDYVLGQPLYIYDSSVPGGRRWNAAAFKAPPTAPGDPYSITVSRQGTFGRNVLRQLPIWGADVSVGREFKFTEKWKLQFKAECFNIFNHPVFGGYYALGSSFTTPSTFGVATNTLNKAIGCLSGACLNPLYQPGGPRDIQLSLKLTF